MQVFIKINDQQQGPFSTGELRKMISTGEFSCNDLVYLEAENQWVKAGESDEYKSLFEKDESLQKTVYAIGGGKGGVGKTVTTASLGVGLATLGNQVVIVDADLGGANLHTCMGILEPEYTFYHFYTLQRETLGDILLDTPVENLKLISGACGTLGLANPKYTQKLRFISNLKSINADYILLDLGAGASYNVIDFFLAADQRIVVTSPEPMAVQETFNFVKIAIFRKLQRHFRKNEPIVELLESDSFAEPGRMGITVGDLLVKIKKIDSQAFAETEQILHEFNPKLVLNMVHEKDETKEGTTLKTAVEELLAIEMDFVGIVEYDESVRNSVKDLKPYLLANPKSKASRSLAKLISVGLLQKSGWRGFSHKRQLIRRATEESMSYPTNQLKESDVICSVNCFYWGDCDFQNGGYPCPVRHLDPIFKR
jgi:flagellar biosynthesis protein FlhG